MAWKEYLKHIYFDVTNPISFAGPTKIYNYLRKEGTFQVSLYAIKQWLQDIDSYALNVQPDINLKQTESFHKVSIHSGTVI